MRTVQVYIEGQRLDLFDDETISVTSTQQNVQDISKVFTDFSQSFSVPASVKNNEIFQHFYENDIDSTLDFNVRRNGNIEIDFTPFRTGKISLEKAEVKNNKAYSYQITFYGDILSLKDKFSNDKLVDLTWLNIFKHEYTGTEVLNRTIDGTTNYVLRYPLIVGRDVTYGDGGSTDINPSTGTGAIHYDELFPAIRLAAILGAMQAKYLVTFQGTFLTDKRFQNAYLHCQNADTFVFNTPPTLADFTTLYTDPSNNNTSLTASDFFDVTEETLTISQFNVPANFPNPTGSNGIYGGAKHTISISIQNVSDTSITYYTDIHINGQLFQTIEGVGNGVQQAQLIPNSTLNTPRVFTFFVRSTASLTLDLFVTYVQEAKYQYENAFFIPQQEILRNYFDAKASYAITAEISVVNYLPDMTVESFFAGILKMFNLTCYGIEADVYQVEPLSDWYDKGAVVDITKYTDIESINVDRVKLFRNVEFKYQESESATNTIFRDLTSRGYGNTSENFDYDGGDFKVEVPFENMMQQKFVDTNLQIGETINTDGNRYTPKPLILYQYDQLAAAWSFNDGAHTTQSQYVPFGQDLIDTNINYTLNFNADISTLLNQTVPNTLFSVYYQSYLGNLYNLKNRETTVKTNLPISLLTNLKLNDRLIIRDKRYMINDMKSNLTTGEVNFTLLNDFSAVISGGTNVPVDPLQPSDGAQCLDVRILFPNGATSATITTTDTGVTITPSTLTTDGTIEVCIPANADTIGLLVTEDDSAYINTENFRPIRTEEGTVFIYTLLVTYSYPDGSQVQNQIFIQQQP